MFDKILIANRGEIACRVIRTARRLSIGTVAVYSAADAAAPHVVMADEAFHIGPAPAVDSYLQGERIIEVALAAGAQAIHPGYGFLAENAEFAEACARRGLVFIGPPAGAIRAMGSKIESKRLMEGAGVPLVPGYHGAGQSDGDLAAAAERIGYPVLVKASAGGGGKGMRVVHSSAALGAALAGARREAKAAFADDALLLELYLDHPRHVEIQVFADAHGNAVSLFERDCSIQRRHQKVLEEAPAPDLSDEVRQAMAKAAVAAAKAVGYVGAGTVEFLYQDGRFHFIEMNTRLQVEHPVTEMITGLDLVEWQFLVAAGRPLPLRQDQIASHGHAIEARIYAEDPAREFLPTTGRIVHLRPPAENPHLRIDSGVAEGGEVSAYYDPMLAKLIVWGEDRGSAVRRLRRALAQYELAGPATNVGFLSAVANHPAFAAFQVDTGFIGRHQVDLMPRPGTVSDEALAFAAASLLLEREQAAGQVAARSTDSHSPWHRASGWRMNEDNHQTFRFIAGEMAYPVTVHFGIGGWVIDLPDRCLTLRGARREGRAITAELDGSRKSATVVVSGFDLTILLAGASWRLVLDDPSARAGGQDVGGGTLCAPMTGTVVQVLVEPGQAVDSGQPLVAVEAMKMEHVIAAPSAGTVTEVYFQVGEQVADGVDLVGFEPAEARA